MNRLLLFQNKVTKNAIWIVACRIIQSLLALVVGMISARYLGPSNYGLINYAASVTSFVIPIAQLGLNNILVHELLKHPEKESAILGTSLVLSFFSSLVCTVGIYLFVSFVNADESTTIIVCMLYSMSILFQCLEMIQYWFQAHYLSKYISIVSLVAYLIVSAYKIFLLICRKSIFWFAISNALDYMLIALLLIIIFHRKTGKRFCFDFRIAKHMLSKSRYYIVSSLMVTIFAQTDRIMLKIMLGDASVGYYTAATGCVGITSFIYTAIVDSARPLIFSSLSNSKKQFETNITRLYCVITYISLLQSFVMSIFAKPIINFLYGDAYFPAAIILRLIVWYSTFSYYGIVRNIWILAENKQKYLWIINLSGALANVLLNYFLIPILDAQGAAIASLVTQIFTNIIVGFIIKPIRRNNELLLKGLNPMILNRLIKSQ